MKSRLLAWCIALAPFIANGATEQPDWVDTMRAVHAGFDGKPGYVAQLGDSITYSMAFWEPLSRHDPAVYLDPDDGLPLRPAGRRWQDVIRGTADKGPQHGNFSGWTSTRVLAAARELLPTRRPEVAIILAGSNDIRGGTLPTTYRSNMEAIVDACLQVHCIPILNTLPPFRGRDAQVAAANRIIRDIAQTRNIPLADYHAACLARRPGNSWDGTLISPDGIHPSGGKVHSWNECNLAKSGYALRTWVNFLVYREIYFRVLNPPADKAR